MFLEDKHFHDLNPILLGKRVCDPGYSWTYSDYPSRQCLIHYAISGTGKLYINNQTYTVDAGQSFIISPGDTATYVADEISPWYYTWIIFTGSLVENFKKLGPVVTVDSDIFLRMLDAFNIESMKEEYLTSLLFMLYRDLMKQSLTNIFSTQVRNYIGLHFPNDIKIKDIAKVFNLSRKQLSFKFKEETGMTLSDYTLSIKMQHAKMGIKENSPMSYIADSLGYSDQFAFSTAFKNYYGYSPSEYRKRLKLSYRDDLMQNLPSSREPL
ncbi:MAG: AraC family transcriptional regulator [Bacillota bacterium]|nr:AraC family transcriptional regulator [Bacillota bacterium]